MNQHTKILENLIHICYIGLHTVHKIAHALQKCLVKKEKHQTNNGIATRRKILHVSFKHQTNNGIVIRHKILHVSLTDLCHYTHAMSLCTTLSNALTKFVRDLIMQ